MRFRLFIGRNVAPVMPLCPPLSVQQNSGGAQWPQPGWTPSTVGAAALWASRFATEAAQQGVASAVGNMPGGRSRHADKIVQPDSDGLGDADALVGLGFGVARLAAGRSVRPGGFEHGPDDLAAVGGGQNPERA